jgi:PPOX class probable F420-dependent enzyme
LGPRDLELLERSRHGYLATADRAARPHLVPLCYAVVADRVYFVVDEKPKTAGRTLKRLRNIADNPAVALLVDVWDEDWSRLEYLLVEGRAVTVDDEAEYSRALARLRQRYPQYLSMQLERGRNVMVRIAPERVHRWRAS